MSNFINFNRLNLIKRNFLLILSLIITLSLQAQEIPHHKKLKYDFLALLKGITEHNFDVLHYKFNWRINFDSRIIHGNVSIQIRSLVNNLNKITLHLADNLKITKIMQGKFLLDFVHHNNLLDIYLSQNLNMDEKTEIEISYYGNPKEGLNFSYHNNYPIIWSLNEPSGARYWFPCYDHPSDKATVEIKVTVPAGMIVASNGKLINAIANNDNTVTYFWKEDYPIATYLISISATNYEIFRDYYLSSKGEDMEIVYFVYPEDFVPAQEDFSVTPSMVKFFSSLFGEYPFIEEKYGMAEIPGSIAMEHQTCTSYPSTLITGNHKYDWIVAHELAHQWWGDLVTLSDWPDIWLNEGFATYSDALWHEHIYGFEGLKSRMANFKSIYFNLHRGSDHPVYNPPSGHLFCSIEYEKAAWVLHMLRFIVGDSKFWKILKRYALLYAYSNASTNNFQQICEEIYGESLEWFFNEWIYKSGYPVYQFGWGVTELNKIRIIINQIQKDSPIFIMPIELKFIFPTGELRKIIWVENENNVFEFSFDQIPREILFDPDNWILCKLVKFEKKGKKRK